jgi:hypothetical protein
VSALSSTGNFLLAVDKYFDHSHDRAELYRLENVFNEFQRRFYRNAGEIKHISLRNTGSPLYAEIGEKTDISGCPTSPNPGGAVNRITATAYQIQIILLGNGGDASTISLRTFGSNGSPISILQ